MSASPNNAYRMACWLVTTAAIHSLLILRFVTLSHCGRTREDAATILALCFLPEWLLFFVPDLMRLLTCHNDERCSTTKINADTNRLAARVLIFTSYVGGLPFAALMSVPFWDRRSPYYPDSSAYLAVYGAYFVGVGLVSLKMGFSAPPPERTGEWKTVRAFFDLLVRSPALWLFVLLVVYLIAGLMLPMLGAIY